MSNQDRNTRIRELGSRFALFLKGHNHGLNSTTKLQAVVSDILGAEQTLLLPIKELIASPVFQQLAPLAGKGSGAIQRDSAIQALSSTFSNTVVADIETFLGGFLDLPSMPQIATNPPPADSPTASSQYNGIRSNKETAAKAANRGKRWALLGMALLGTAGVIMAAGSWNLNVPQTKPRQLAATAKIDPAIKAFAENGRSIKLDDSKQSGEIISGPIRINAEVLTEKTGNGVSMKTPVVSVSVNGQEVGRLVGSQSPYASSVVQLADLDPSNKYPEVILSSFTGGAHCCNEIKTLTSDTSGTNWNEVKIGSYDGGPSPAEDPLKNGRFYIAVSDNRFLYKFTNYACSVAPTSLLRLDGKNLKDVTFDHALIPYHTKALKSLEESFSSRIANGSDSDCINGFLAGYVANKALAGELESGWQDMLKSYFRGSDWGMKECQAGFDDKGECRGPETVYSSFPEALKSFLLKSGYIKVGSASSLST